MSSGQRRYSPGDEPVSGYRLIAFLGAGTFGEVWRASSPGGAGVAIKFISLAEGEGYVEFAALQRVKHVRHPNLTTVHASWLRGKDGKIMDEQTAQQITEKSVVPAAGGLRRTDQLRDTTSFPRPIELIVAMGLGDKTLFEELQDCQTRGQEGIPVDELLDYMEGAAKGIDYLNKATHDMGPGGRKMSIIHGDIKPANLLLVGGAAQVCDFGLATAVETARETQHIRGSVAYAAPEALDKKRHVASDQYSLAVSYVELRTGDLPFSHDSSVAQIVAAHLRGDLDLAKLSPGERDVIKRATLLDPDNRWKSCAEMVRRLQRAVEGSPDAVSEESKADEPPRPLPEITKTPSGQKTPSRGSTLPDITSAPYGTMMAPSAESGAAAKTLPTGGATRVIGSDAESREKPEDSTAALEAAKETIPHRDTSRVAPDDRVPGARPWRRRAAIALGLLAIPVALWFWWNAWETKVRSDIEAGTNPLAAIMARIEAPPSHVSFGTIKQLREYAQTKWLDHASAHEKASQFKEAIIKYGEVTTEFNDKQGTTGQQRVRDAWIDRAGRRLEKQDFRGSLEDCDGVIAALPKNSGEALTLRRQVLEAFQADWQQRVTNLEVALSTALAELDEVAPGDFLVDHRDSLRDHARTVWLNQATADMQEGAFDKAFSAYEELLGPDCFPDTSEIVALRDVAVQCRDVEEKLRKRVKDGKPALKQIIEDLQTDAPSEFPETQKDLLREYGLQAWLARGLAEFQDGDLDAAEATCGEVTDYSPGNSAAEKLLADIEEKRKVIVEPPPIDRVADWKQSVVDESRKASDRRQSSLQELIDQLKTPDWPESTPDLQRSLGEFARRVWLYEAVVAFGSADGSTSSDFPRVADLCKNILVCPEFEDDTEAKMLLARAQVRLGKIDDAKAGLESLTLSDVSGHLHLLYLTLKAATAGFKTEEGAAVALDQLKKFDVSWAKAEGRMTDAESAQPPSAGDDPYRIDVSFWRPGAQETAGLRVARDGVFEKALDEVQSLVLGADLAGAAAILELATELTTGEHTAPNTNLVSQIGLYRTLLDSAAEPKTTTDAIAMADGRIRRADTDEQTAMAIALSETAQKNHPYTTLKPELLSAIGVVRGASTNPHATEIHKQLGVLWDALVALRIEEEGLPAETDRDELSKLADDWDKTIRNAHESGLIDAWRAECALVLDGNLSEAYRLAGRATLPADADFQRKAYVGYVQASTLTDPSDVLAKLGQIFPDPMPQTLPKFLTAGKHARLMRTIAMVNQAVGKQRQTTGWDETLSASDLTGAKQHAAFLWRVYDSLQEEERRSGTTVLTDPKQRIQLKINVALAELRSQTPADTSPPTTDPRAAPSPRNLLQLFDNRELEAILATDLKSDTIPVLQMVLRISLLRAKEPADAPASRRLAMKACSRLLALLHGGKSDDWTLDDAQIVEFYGKKVEPVLTLAALVEAELKNPAAAQPQKLADAHALEELYVSVASLIRDRERAEWPFPRPERLVDLYSRAIGLHVTWPPGQPSGKTLSGYYVRRGYSRAVLQKYDGPDGAISDAEAAEKAGAGVPGNSRGSDGLKCLVYLLKAQQSSTSRVENLKKSIEAGNRAVDGCPDDEPLLPNYLSDLTNAYVWRANFLVGDFDQQEADLLAAEKHANRLLDLPGTRPISAYIATGNALEDLAWNVGRDPVANYTKALAAFQRARDVDPTSSAAACAIGRLYYKYLVESSLDPALLENANDDDKALMGKAKSILQDALRPDRGLLEAHYYAAKVAEYLQDYQAADGQYATVRDKWSNKKEETYWKYCLAAYANLPLLNAQDPQSLAKALARGRELEQLANTSPSLASLSNTVVLLRARSAMNEPDLPQALTIFQEAIPGDLADAKTEHIELLFTRIFCYKFVFAGRASRKTAEDAIRDAQTVATLATSRQVKASALMAAADMGRLLFDFLKKEQGAGRADVGETRKALARAIQHGREAVVLARRHPENWRTRLVLAQLLVRQWSVEHLEDSLEQVQQGITILAEAAELLDQGASMTEDSWLTTVIARDPALAAERKTLLEAKNIVDRLHAEEKTKRDTMKAKGDQPAPGAR